MIPYINLTATWALFGLIWVTQIVTYPGFMDVGVDSFKVYHQNYMGAITLVVMPLMLTELGVGCWLVWHNHFHWEWLIPLILVGIIWASTFFLQVPMHETLVKGKDTDVIHSLVQTNWIRTIAWTLKAAWLTHFIMR